MRQDLLIMVAVTLFSAYLLSAAEPNIVSHISVTSDKVEDVSSLEAWKKAFIKDDMTDEQKAIAIWTTVVKFRHQDPPPLEFLTGDGGDVHDPIKTFNVYGYNMCCCESSNICALARYAGLKARGWGINGHSVPEIFYNDAWHLFDASLICYFRKPDQSVASVEEIIGDVNNWYDKNPGYRKNSDKLYKFMIASGWKKGPAVLANTVAYDTNGWLPAATHGWYSTMQEYDGRGGGKDGKAFQYEYGYSQGYQVNIQLRPGEKLTRYFNNGGDHINRDGNGGEPGALKQPVGADQLRYSPAFGDLAPGRIGHGRWEYDVTIPKTSTAHEIVIPMKSSYVLLSGKLTAKAPAGTMLELSFNNGLDWKPLATINVPPSLRETEDYVLDPLIRRKYSYLLRVTGADQAPASGHYIFDHDIQLSQRALPALDKGDNKITFNAGPDEGTVTIEAQGSLENKNKQNTFMDFHPILENMEDGKLIIKGGAGSVAFPIKTPGEMTRLRFGCFYRARDPKDVWDYQVSFDGGKSYKTIDRAAGPTGNGQCKYVIFNDIPPGTKEALVRFSGQQRNTTMISNFRIDADYKEPDGGFIPVKITYAFSDGHGGGSRVHIAKTANDSYTITCKEKPIMGSIMLELAP